MRRRARAAVASTDQYAGPWSDAEVSEISRGDESTYKSKAVFGCLEQHLGDAHDWCASVADCSKLEPTVAAA
jgi:hypothetical protein